VHGDKQPGSNSGKSPPISTHVDILGGVSDVAFQISTPSFGNVIRPSEVRAILESEIREYSPIDNIHIYTQTRWGKAVCLEYTS
jgi:hypothetical protein